MTKQHGFSGRENNIAQLRKVNEDHYLTQALMPMSGALLMVKWWATLGRMSQVMMITHNCSALISQCGKCSL